MLTVNDLSKRKAPTHFFVNNVEGENTEAVELLLAGGGAHRVERATVSSFNHYDYDHLSIMIMIIYLHHGGGVQLLSKLSCAHRMESATEDSTRSIQRSGLWSFYGDTSETLTCSSQFA